MDIVQLIISLISGIVGGNVVGAAAPDKSLGTVGNSVAGFFGGGLSNYVLQAIGLFATAVAATGTAPAAPHGLDFGVLLGNIAGSGVGGALLTFIVGMIKESMNKTA